MEKYFIGLDKMSLDELEIYRLLCRYSNYETDVAGYTIQQLLVASDSRLGLTTQRIRTILKKFEKDGYIQFLTSGSKGKESTLKLTIKQQLFNNNSTNKSEELQEVEDLANNNLTTKQQLTNNTTKKKKKEKNINIVDIDYIWGLYPNKQGKKVAYTKIEKLLDSIGKEKLEECIKNYIESVEEDRKRFDRQYLNGSTFFNGRYIDYLEANKKAPAGTGADKKTNYDNSICKREMKNTPAVKEYKFV